MTVRGVFFTAHDRRTAERALVRQPLQPTHEERRPRGAIVEHIALIVVELIPRWPPTQLIAQIEIANTRALDGIFKLGAIEMRYVARVGS